MVNGPVEGDEQFSRQHLALTRTRLANERTMLAYARTAIMLAVAGVTLLKLYADIPWAAVSGGALVAASMGVGVFGAKKYRRLSQALR